MNLTPLILTIVGLTVTLSATPTHAEDRTDDGVYCLFHYIGPNGDGHDYYAWYHNPENDCVNKTMTFYHHTDENDYSFCNQEDCIHAIRQSEDAPAERAEGKNRPPVLENPITRNTAHHVALKKTGNPREGGSIKPFGAPTAYRINTSCDPETPRYKHILLYYYTITYDVTGQQTIICLAFESEEPEESEVVPTLDAGLKPWAARQSGTREVVSADDRIELHFGNHSAVCFIATPINEWFCE